MKKHHKNTHPGSRHEGHRLVTRRDFLGQGLVSGMAMVTAPSLLGFFGNSTAMAQDAGVGGGGGKIPFMVFDLAGGSNTAGSNVLVGGPGGQLDPLSIDGYKKLGLPEDMTPDKPGQINDEMGLLFHSDSALLRGMQSMTSASTRANMNGMVFCARSDNDTGNNPHNPMYGINKAGANGSVVPLIGTRSSDSGGKSAAPQSMIDLEVRPTKVDRPSDVTGLVDVGDAGAAGAADAAAIMAAVEQVSALKINTMTEEQMVKDLMMSSYSETTTLIEQFADPATLDPLLDPIITSIFPNNEASDDKTFRKTASVMKMVVNGFAGAGTIEIGGYDYHGGGRSEGEVKDFKAGQAMGAAFEYAARLNKQLVVYMLSDGSVSSNGVIDNSAEGRGKYEWKSDSSSTAATTMLVYNPGGQPTMTSPTANQLGYYRANGSVETTATPASNNVNLLSETVVLNYMALHNDIGRFNEVLPNNGLGAGANLDSFVGFNPIRA